MAHLTIDMSDLILTALANLLVKDLSYADWIKVGMALHNSGYACDVWDEWSKGDPRYKQGECAKKWDTFDDSGNSVTEGTIVYLAKQHGWDPAENTNTAFDWNSKISYDGDGTDINQSVSEVWSSTDELMRFLNALFDENDVVGYICNFYCEDDGKWKPANKGVYTRTAGDLLETLKSHPDDIAYTIGDWTKEAGARISFNPLDGKGIKRENVIAYRFALVEFDDIDISDQEKIVRELRLPVATLTTSGGRSLHAIVHIDASDEDEYKERVNFLFDYLKQHGYPVDEQNKNPNRMTRMPGVSRNGQKQNLIDVNIGTRSWDEWYEYITSPDDDLPSIVNLKDYVNNLPQQPQELIEGILRQGHKMLLAAASKAGKSFLLMELCIAIAEGTPWLGFRCRQGTVLYVNLEIDPASTFHRFRDIYDALNITAAHADNIMIWNLRGHAKPLSELVDSIVKRAEHKNYDAIILDPIYKLNTADENSAAEMGKFCNLLDRICTETGSSVIYAHHHSKGAQGGKRAADRASGSGVFHRDADALLDIIELEVPDKIKQDKPNISAWRMESSLREFPNITPLGMFFDYPIHRLDADGSLEKCHPLGSTEANLNKSPKRTTHDDRMSELDDAYEACAKDGGPVKLSDMAKVAKCCEKSLRRYIVESDGKYTIQKGYVLKNRDK